LVPSPAAGGADEPRPPEIVGIDGVAVPDGLRRLWAPHRLAYIKGEPGTGRADEQGCPFCRIPALPDEDGLVVARRDLGYAVLNLHPYNPGHLMVVPYRHVAGYDELTVAEVAEVGLLTQQALVALRAASAPHGFNVGLNLGGVAGGSLAAHLHQHVVPRWGGDANFVTVIGQTKVIPALLAETRQLLVDAWPGSARDGHAPNSHLAP
jgi:ATP adenylyltransferase